MKKTMTYLQYLFKYRYFWVYLARCDLIARYRRSKLGMLWIVLSPLLLTLLIAFVFGTIFKQSMADYAPYILAGMLAWEFISASFVANGMTFIACESYIRQYNHPVSLYTLKATIVATANLMISMSALGLWSLLINPSHLLMGLLTFPLTLTIFFFLGWALSTIAAFLNAKYRDYPQMMVIIMQALWYISPVFFRESMFEGNVFLSAWFQINPVTHLLYLLRKPFIYGQMPDWADYGFSFALVVLCGLIALWMNKRNSKKVIFYL